MNLEKAVNPHFEDFLFDWTYGTYLLVGGYGSSKSYHVALKLILKCFQEVRKVLVVREVYDTIRESCFDLFTEILDELDLLAEGYRVKGRVQARTSPMQLIFPNGSRIIFKGMDKPSKLKSINGLSIVWLEEPSEIKYEGYKELRGRVRHPSQSIHFILSVNPVDMGNWTYEHFFKRLDDDGNEVVVLDDEVLYKRRTMVVGDTYYHHSVADDNYFLPDAYIKALDEMRLYDPDLYRIAREGRFGVNGRKVLPQFVVAPSHQDVITQILDIDDRFHFTGMDFGFETSYNAVLKVAVDDEKKWLYIYDEYYRNNMTDDQTVVALQKWDPNIKGRQIIADSNDAKSIRYFQLSGFLMRGCHKFSGSRLANTKKMKRFRRIVCSPKCVNTVRELKNLTYAKDANGNLKYDEFNIDPHTFSALWYALDRYTVADVKETARNTKRGEQEGFRHAG
jgi:phage terminase large subunit